MLAGLQGCGCGAAGLQPQVCLPAAWVARPPALSASWVTVALLTTHHQLPCAVVQVEEVRLLPVADIEQEIKARREHERRTGGSGWARWPPGPLLGVAVAALCPLRCQSPRAQLPFGQRWLVGCCRPPLTLLLPSLLLPFPPGAEAYDSDSDDDIRGGQRVSCAQQ